mmetsp:Transcript_11223/g.28420  ORF Transcript_11223/g.28420 Transcript_11223/m.28420 type:complete len:81 (-) Transcript_11223:59-301(-)
MAQGAIQFGDGMDRPIFHARLFVHPRSQGQCYTSRFRDQNNGALRRGELHSNGLSNEELEQRRRETGCLDLISVLAVEQN